MGEEKEGEGGANMVRKTTCTHGWLSLLTVMPVDTNQQIANMTPSYLVLDPDSSLETEEQEVENGLKN
jgi:hypothetical protein